MMHSCLVRGSSSELDENVLILNHDNFQKVIDENAFVLVEFYAPTCGACISLQPEYNKAAVIMAERNSSIKIAKLNAMQETEIAKKHGVDGFPTVRFFRKGLSSLDYKGLRSAEDIVSWVIKRTGPPAIEVKSVEEAEELIKNNKVVTIGFFEDSTSESTRIYLSAADSSEDSIFAITFEQDVRDVFNAKPGDIILYNEESESEAIFDNEYTQHEIERFAELGSLPVIMEFRAENAMHVFGGYMKTHLLLFLSRSDANTEQILEDMKPVAKYFKQKLLFTFFDTDNSEFKSLLGYLGVTEDDDIPTVRLIHFQRRIIKYKPEKTEINKDNMRNFINDFFEGNLKQTLKSDTLPEDWNKNPVHVLVGDNFESVIRDPAKDVLVEFYAPWCTFCNKFAPEYERIGKYFEKDEDIIIAKIDATTNEFDGIEITSLPTIILFTKNGEDITYIGGRTLEGIVTFIESGGLIQNKVEEEDINEEPINTDKDGDESIPDKESIETSSVKEEL